MLDRTAMTVDLETTQVLIVDDNRQMLRLLRGMLRGLRLRRVHKARDAIEALELMRTVPIDLVLLDWMMQPLDGLECAKLLRSAADSPNPFCSIIMVSGHANKARVREARDAGVNSFVVKPVSTRALHEHINATFRDTRPFIRTVNCIGPDRRRAQDLDHNGFLRRAEDAGRAQRAARRS